MPPETTVKTLFYRVRIRAKMMGMANLGVYSNVSRKVVVALPFLKVSLSQIAFKYGMLLGGPWILHVDRAC